MTMTHLFGRTDKDATNKATLVIPFVALAFHLKYVRLDNTETMSRRRALLIGINYTGTPHQLAGCCNDVDTMRALLHPRGFVATCLKDDGSTPLRPTRANILRAMSDLIGGAAAGDALVMHYSGHGTRRRDSSNDEASDDDGHDEALCPSDGGVITDDELRRLLVAPLPAGCSLLVVLDCCHSGTGMDLRYTYTDTSTFKHGRVPDEYVPSDWTIQRERHYNRKCDESAADVVCLSGCVDSGTSADTVSASGRACGAMTAAFQAALRKTNGTALDMFHYVNGVMRCYRYQQRPQLSLGSVALTVRAEAGTLLLLPPAL